MERLGQLVAHHVLNAGQGEATIHSLAAGRYILSISRAGGNRYSN